MDKTVDVQLIHLSDIHFGSNHICQPVGGSSGNGIADLASLIISDIQECEFVNDLQIKRDNTEPETPLLLALSGDFTQQAQAIEFEQAQKFIGKFLNGKMLGSKIPISNVFSVPGNHDVLWNEKDPKNRFERYSGFFNEVYDGAREAITPHKISELNRVIYLEKERIVFVELNSCLFVEKDTVDASRGQIDFQAIASIRAQLEIIPDEELADCVKIAMIHHHPILLPTFFEVDKSYDAVVNARSLLAMLNQYQFHMLLHGHKHYPQVFTYDPQIAWDEKESNFPQLVVAGGSCGSNELPKGTKSSNTYNLIQIKWHPKAQMARIKVITRGLVTVGPAGGLDPDQWQWRTDCIVDRVLATNTHLPKTQECTQLPAPKDSDASQQARSEVYSKQNGYMATCEVMPSLVPGQVYEARAWIVIHGNKPQPTGKKLEKVIWSAGKMFEKNESIVSPSFCVSFHYWGATLLQAQLFFEDGTSGFAYVYARVPKKESD